MPISCKPFCLDCQLSPINTVEKPDSPDGGNSWPQLPKGGSSVNAAIGMDRFVEDGGALSYPSVDAIVELVVNPLRAKFFRGNINIYLHFVSFLHIDTTQVVEILPQVRQEPIYST